MTPRVSCTRGRVSPFFPDAWHEVNTGPPLAGQARVDEGDAMDSTRRRPVP